MNTASFRELLYVQPFTPFRIHMGDGCTVVVRHPETAIVTDQEVAVAADENGQSRLRLLALSNINQIERIETTV